MMKANFYQNIVDFLRFFIKDKSSDSLVNFFIINIYNFMLNYLKTVCDIFCQNTQNVNNIILII